MKKTVGPLVLLFIAVICRIIYLIIGTEIMPDGTLVEPFYLIGIGSILTMIAGVWILILASQMLLRISRKKIDEVK